MGLVCALGCFSEGFFDLLGDFSIVGGEISRIRCANCVVVLGRDYAGNLPPQVGEAFAVIAPEDYCGGVLRGTQLVTCGISNKNAVSATSRTEDKITLSLNRALHTKSGITEPLELPVPACGDEYELMAAFAARLLLS